MGMTPEVFDAMTPAHFVYAWLGWSHHQEQLHRQAWEQERWSVWVLTSIQLERKDRRAMTEMFPLPWEESQTLCTEELTLEERKERIRQILYSNPLTSTHNEYNENSPADHHGPATNSK